MITNIAITIAIQMEVIEDIEQALMWNLNRIPSEVSLTSYHAHLCCLRSSIYEKESAVVVCELISILPMYWKMFPV